MRYAEIIKEEIIEESVKTLVDKVLSYYHQEKDSLVASLQKLKRILSQEKSETKKMLAIYSRALESDNKPSKEEMVYANSQLIELLKLVGLALPQLIPLPLAGTLTIILVVKLGKKFDLDVLPKSFSTI